MKKRKTNQISQFSHAKSRSRLEPENHSEPPSCVSLSLAGKLNAEARANNLPSNLPSLAARNRLTSSHPTAPAEIKTKTNPLLTLPT